MSEVLLTAEGVSKKFCKSLNKSMRYGVSDVWQSMFGGQRINKDLRPAEFWSLEDVSFELKRGDCLGLIGPNGAGKSTLLKMLNGIIAPDKGKISLVGRVGALIEVGAGFHPMLTGRENVYINGAILGLSKYEIDGKFDEIVEFAELRDFIDSPIKHYSSGMHVRLGFAIAAQMRPDILLIDEVLAVGDVGFRAKCYNHIAGMMSNSAVVLVSHSIGHIARYCNNVMFLAGGKVRAFGNLAEVLEVYYSFFKREAATELSYDGNKLYSFNVLDINNRPIASIEHGELLRLSGEAQIELGVRQPIVHIVFMNRELVEVAVCKSMPGTLVNVDGCIAFTVDIRPFILNYGDYKISLLVFDETNQRHLIWHSACWDIKVIGSGRNYDGASVYFRGEWN